MSDIAIYGAGGFGRETALLIQQLSQTDESWNLIGFFDDGLKKGAMVDSLPVLGGIEELNNYTQPLGIVMAIADPANRRTRVEGIINRKVTFPAISHPSALLGSPSNSFGHGVIITAGVILTTGVRIGDFSIINLATTIGHDATVGEFTAIMPQCSISGNVTIGNGTYIGAGARILQGVTLGADCVVGAGAVVTQPFPNGSKVVGVPARAIDTTA